MAGGRLLASEVASQIAIHRQYGGVVPEVASRNHLTTLRPAVDAALRTAALEMADIEAFCATRGPGLASSLMIGFSAAKAMAIGREKPFFAVNHIEGHLLSPFFHCEEGILPAIGLVVSGGHTLLVEIRSFSSYRLLGKTRDDAAGEAFDKVGKLLGLSYPGGPNIDRLAREGNPGRYDFPRSMLGSGDLNFSFSGLKTAVRYLLPKLGVFHLPDVCASFQEAVVDVLWEKCLRAVEETAIRRIALSGGVSCNSRLRARFTDECDQRGIELLIAEPSLCTDNAAMIAFVGNYMRESGRSSALDIDIDPNLRLADSAAAEIAVTFPQQR